MDRTDPVALAIFTVLKINNSESDTATFVWAVILQLCSLMLGPTNTIETRATCSCGTASASHPGRTSPAKW